MDPLIIEFLKLIGWMLGLALFLFWLKMMSDAWHNESIEDRWRYVLIIMFLSFVGAGWYYYYRKKPRDDIEKKQRKQLMQQEKGDKRFKINKDKIYDVVLFVGGSLIIVANMLDGRRPNGGVVAIGVAMIVYGFLRRNWKKKK